MTLHDEAGEPWTTARIGAFGEQVARRWLWLVGGCHILAANFRPPGGGELDLVARDGDTLAFIEVKTRTSLEFGRPALAVDAEKQALLVRGARAWMGLLRWPQIYFRFDIVEVVLAAGKPPAVTWVRSAFLLPDRLRW